MYGVLRGGTSGRDKCMKIASAVIFRSVHSTDYLTSILIPYLGIQDFMDAKPA